MKAIEKGSGRIKRMQDLVPHLLGPAPARCGLGPVGARAGGCPSGGGIASVEARLLYK